MFNLNREQKRKKRCSEIWKREKESCIMCNANVAPVKVNCVLSHTTTPVVCVCLCACVYIFSCMWLHLSKEQRASGTWRDARSKVYRTEVPAALSYHLGVEAEWAHSFPHWDSLPGLIRHLCDWRPEFSACQLIWSHRYGSNLIWGERAGFCQYGWDKAAAFTNPLNKLSREGPVSW